MERGAQIVQIPQKIIDEMISRRRDFHKYPERGWTEFRTTAVCAEVLGRLGWSVRFADEFIEPSRVMGRDADAQAEKRRALEQGAPAETLSRIGEYTGLCAELRCGCGPLTVMRFDIDCVETAESAEASHRPAALGFTSVNAGLSHSCGHDGHAAVGLALAEMLSSARQKLRGTIRFIFQPAEEGVRGGYACAPLAAGADSFIAMHLGLGLPTGHICGGTGGFLCSTKFDAEFKGAAAHAGGEPERGRNALLAAAQAALAIHSIAPHSGGVMRVNVGVLRAGEGRNVVPPHALMKIETRGENGEVASYAYERAEAALRGAAQMYGAELAIKKQGETITAESDEKLAKLVADEALSVRGVTKAELYRKMPGSDDACWLMREAQKSGGLSTYVCVGADTPAGHHNGAFDLDEAALPIALELLYKTTLRLNAAQ